MPNGSGVLSSAHNMRPVTDFGRIGIDIGIGMGRSPPLLIVLKP